MANQARKLILIRNLVKELEGMKKGITFAFD